MNVKDLKEGTCIVKQNEGFNEAVILKRDKNLYKLSFFDTGNGCYSSINKKSKNGFLTYLSKNHELAEVPHFCLIENAYSVLSKYGTDFELIGICDLLNEKEETLMNAIYLKTSKNTFLEIIVCYLITDTNYPVLWINETESVSELHFLNALKNGEICNYYFSDNLQVKLEEANMDSNVGFCLSRDGKGIIILMSYNENVKDNTLKIGSIDKYMPIFMGRENFVNRLKNL